MDSEETDKHQQGTVKKLKTDIKLLREMLKEEKLRNSKLTMLLKKEKLKSELDGSPTFQMQKVRQDVEMQYQRIVQDLQTHITTLEN